MIRLLFIVTLAGCGSRRAPPVETLRTTDGEIAVGNLNAQIEGAERAGRTGPLIPLLSMRAQALGRPEDWARADELADQWVRAAPNDAAARLARAGTRASLHRFREALEDADAAERLGARVEKLRASVWLATGDEERALPILEERARKAPDIDTLGELAALHGQLGRIDEAEREFVDAQNHYRDVSPFALAWLYFQNGLMEERAGRLSEARERYRAAHERLPAYAAATGHLAGVLAALGQKDEAARLLRPLALELKDPEYAGQLAALVGDSALRDRAAGRYDELLAKFPEAYGDHAARFFLTVDATRALRLAQANWKNRPTADASALVIEAALAAGKTDLACAQANQKVRQNVAWQIVAARAYLACGKKAEAEALMTGATPPPVIPRR